MKQKKKSVKANDSTRLTDRVSKRKAESYHSICFWKKIILIAKRYFLKNIFFYSLIKA